MINLMFHLSKTWNKLLNHSLKLEKPHKATKLNQSLWLESYLGSNTELKKKAKKEVLETFL